MQRKRAAILFADVVGYSRLTELDEEGTHRTLTAYRDIWSNIIREHRGRVVNYAGDALLAEMPSPTSALRCAADAQRTIKERNRDVQVDRKLRFRVGINTGSVIVDGEDIFGDGVNIAARLASRGDAGGICISEAEFEQVRPPEDLGFEYLGEIKVKNIAKPVGAIKVLLRPEHAGKIIGHKPKNTKPSPWATAALTAVAVAAVGIGVSSWQHREAIDLAPAAGYGAHSLFEKPSIAVLPFENATGDPEQNYLAASISDGIFTALSKFPDLHVFLTRPVGGENAEQTAADLGTRYLLLGTVRRTADRVRITTQLFDAHGERQAWGGRYDAAFADVFASEDGLIGTIATGLWAELTQTIEAGAWRNETNSAEAYRLAIIGLQHYRRFTPADNTEAKYFFRSAVSLDPAFLSAWAGLGWSYFNEAQYGWGDDAEQSLDRAASLAARVLAIDGSQPEARALDVAINRSRKPAPTVLY